MRRNIIVLIIVVSAISFIAYQNSRYVLNDDNQAVITQFGRVIGKARVVPGEYYKIPFVHKVHYFKKAFHLSENSQEIPTKDKKFISFKKRAFWKISDPIQFYKKLNSYKLAKEFVLDHTGAAERDIVTSHTLAEIVGNVSDNENLNDVDCDRLIEQKIINMAKQSMPAAGISLRNIEAKVTYPLNTRKP